MTEIQSYKELLKVINKGKKAYLLLYKKGTENSDCAYSHYSQATLQVPEVDSYVSDVSQVRDIHTHFHITTAPVLLEFEDNVIKNQIKGCQTTDLYKAFFKENVYQAVVSNNKSSRKRVTVYSTPTCSWCNTLKTYLSKHHIQYTDIDVSKDQRAADELVKRSGQMGVPQTDINGEIIVGFDQSRINQLLNIQ